MKNILLFFVLVLLIVGEARAQNSLVNFNHDSWAEVLKKADKEDKVIFVDAYTTWCGPCKKMSRDVFTNAEVADFFNKTFINVKMDMEKGEGIKIAEDYNVRAYPTLLFIDKKGELVHRAVGYHNTDQFIELGKTASSSSNTLSALRKRYEFGDRSEQFLYDYTFALSDAMMSDEVTKISGEYLDTQKDWGTERNSTFLFRFLNDTESKQFDYFINNKETFVGLFGEAPVVRKLRYLVNNSIQDSADDSALDQISRLYKKIYPEKADEMISDFSMMYYLRAEDIANYVNASKNHFKKYGTNDWEMLNEAAWNFYEFIDKKGDLKKAIKWAQQSMEINKNYYNADTLAALYYKIKSKKKAIRAAEEAIILAKQSGDDYSATMELLERARNL